MPRPYQHNGKHSKNQETKESSLPEVVFSGICSSNKTRNQDNIQLNFIDHLSGAVRCWEEDIKEPDEPFPSSQARRRNRKAEPRVYHTCTEDTTAMTRG